MQFKLVEKKNLKNNTLTRWQFNYVNSKIILDQNIHLDNIIEKHEFKKIHNYNNFINWQNYNNSEKENCEILLFAHSEWNTISNICKILENEESYIFLAINKYLLLPEKDITLNLSDNYDMSIEESLKYFLKNRNIIDYQYHKHENGDVGNFIIPDNRFLISCKK